jgi:hypothetical protein
MNHKKLQILVSSSVDGEVSESERTQVLSHLESCSDCRRFMEQAKRMHSEIASLGEVRLPSSFPSRILDSVEKRDEQFGEWLGIEPSARNTFILLVSVVLIIFFLTRVNTPPASAMNDQLLRSISSDSGSTRVLLQKEYLSKSDVLYAVMNK